MRSLRLRIARENGFSEHVVEFGALTTLLDALETLRAGGDPHLRYRHSCHHGSCGVCGALIDGVEKLMCLTRLAELGSETVTIEALRKMTRIADIAVSPAPFFRVLPEGAGYLRRSELSHSAARLDGGSFERMENCIECGLCVSACPVTRPFVGPAALALADRDREERPQRTEAALAFAGRPDGTAACERRFACSRACPQAVQPGRRIQALRKP